MPARGQTSRRGRALILLLAIIVAGCNPRADSGRLHQQADAALQRWADAIEAAGGLPSFTPIGELTRQLGNWEVAVGDNNKRALISGVVESGVSLSSAAPPDGEARWPDGTTETVRLISASQALLDLQADGAQPCPDCVPLRITAARLTSEATATTRSTADLPVWEFTIEGTAVRISRVAIANRISVTPPPWDPYNAPVGLAIGSATVAPDGRHLTVAFTGSPYTADQNCGADYSGEAVESTTAVVVILNVREHLTLGGCTAVGAPRTAEVTLAAPLGGRAVLDVQQGLPVPVAFAP